MNDADLFTSVPVADAHVLAALRRLHWDGDSPTLGPVIEGFEAILSTVREPAKDWVHDLSFLVPPIPIVHDDEGLSILAWTTVCDLARTATELSVLSMAAFFRSLTTALSQRNMLAACCLGRSLLEHAVLLDHLCAVPQEREWQARLAEDGRRLRDAREFPLDDLAPYWQSMYGSRYNWEELYGRPNASPKELKAAEKALSGVSRSTNVLTLLENRERKRGRIGLAGYYAKLSDCVHPSRGSREVLYYGREVDQDRTLSVLYSTTLPSDEALEQRVAELVVPAVCEAFLIAEQYESTFKPRLNEIGAWAWDALKRRGYDVAALLLEDKRGRAPSERADRKGGPPLH